MSLTNLSAIAKIWLLLVMLAMGPFVLKTGLDSETIQRQGVAEIYRNMQFQSALKNWPAGSPVIFEQQQEKSILEDAFKLNLQKRYKLSEIGEVPRVRVFFDSGTYMNAEVDVEMPDQKDHWQVWQGSARLVNNGIFFGFWLGVVLYLLHHNLLWSLVVAIGVTGAWKASWNVLEIPASYSREISFFAQEIFMRFKNGYWQTMEIARILEMAAAGFLALGFVMLPVLRFFKKLDSMRIVLVFSVLCEPVFLYLATRVASWGGELSWWKIYLGSFAYRFVFLGHLFFSFLKTDYVRWEHPGNARIYRSFPFRMALLSLPVLFIFSGGWSWILSIFSAGSSSALLKLKIFFASTLIAFFLGSRLMTLVLSSLAFSVIFSPTGGHWAAALSWAFLMDGMLLGWFLTPFKGYSSRMMIGEPRIQFFVVTVATWVLGVFLASVGAPETISWAAIVVVLWGYAELIRNQESMERKSRASVGLELEDFN